MAALGATIILVTVVLPAEYGIDPFGTGKALGFTVLSRGAVAPPTPVPSPEGAALAPIQQGSVALYPGEYKIDSREFTLGPYEYIEYKYHLAKDASMLFSWTAGGDVRQDFHGDQDDAASKTSTSYDKAPRRTLAGSFVAPFSGIHGWYWENRGGKPITVKITAAGFFTTAHEFRMNGKRESREVRSLEVISPTTP